MYGVNNISESLSSSWMLNCMKKITFSYSLFVWLVLICSERKVLLAGCWWLVCSERKVLLAGG
jgi:hypothetical protein